MTKKSKKSRDATPSIMDQTYDAIVAQIDLGTFKPTDLIKFATLAMKLVEQIPALSGPEKKDMVIQLADRLATQLPNLTPDELSALQSAINLVLPSAIDFIVAASKGQLNLNTIEQEASSCFPCFSSKTAAKN